MKTNEFLKIFDAITKGIVLMCIMVFIGYYIHKSFITGVELNMPDWIISTVTIVIRQMNLTVKEEIRQQMTLTIYQGKIK
jgi:hypothetical protein